MTIREARDEIQRALTPSVGGGEARAMANIILEDVKGYTPTQLIMYGDRTLLDETVARLRKITQRIIDGEPMQYVIGTARFRGRDFMVDESTLIPRPETGALVDIIIDENRGQKDARILDIGAGSGCIAVSLALDMPFSRVTAIDISAGAIEMTNANAKRLKAHVDAIVADIFTPGQSPIANKEYDIIVSNPPYILESEKEQIDPRVKDHEPAQALFVADDNPIGIYTAIADYAYGHLTHGGKLYLEINPLCAEELKQMLTAKGFEDVRILPDYRSQSRYAICTR